MVAYQISKNRGLNIQQDSANAQLKISQSFRFFRTNFLSK